MKPARGTLINPRIRLLEELGRGAMGSVWRAEHLTLETEVAVKLIASDGTHDEDEALERFTREAKAAAKIKSHHVVQTLDHGVAEGGDPYIVLELLDGESLDAMLARGPLSFEETVLLVTHVARALTSAHALGIIHRDIKPGNIFRIQVESEPFYKVLDFGIAKLEQQRRSVAPADPAAIEVPAQELTVAGALVGTLEYLSPERMTDDGPASPHDDLWALAVVAYKCLTGSLPFTGEDFDALSLAVIQAQHAAPSTCETEPPDGVDAWFGRALAPRAKDRFASAEEMASSLAALASRDAEDPMVDEPRVERGSIRMRAALAVGVIVAVAAVVAGRGDDGSRVAPNATRPARTRATLASEATPSATAPPAQSSGAAAELGKTIASRPQGPSAPQRVPTPAPPSASSNQVESPPTELPERKLGF